MAVLKVGPLPVGPAALASAPTAVLALLTPDAFAAFPTAVLLLKVPTALALFPTALLPDEPKDAAFVPQAKLPVAPDAFPPPPICGSEPSTLPAQTNCACAGPGSNNTVNANTMAAMASDARSFKVRQGWSALFSTRQRRAAPTPIAPIIRRWAEFT